ncbi:amino acid deaminase [Vibrio gazogenes]|uniref:D-serine deaminase, pyridoxal phosphate-dependent n=1 Tax=Vibrio gazogenes DSM 21264 = NBRC 103151 TaxID=1123492 RepID=A0A1M4YED1_VIBGA|nr:amino acid deaminase [Vibrio gazogenes]USP14952.1 amino acid deaminase [Vibrio gazogenes]SHF03998.1 D-serine deaminase, pyridoxal phosphate-dependent [Vibrio gazogenes DSM 21264] [Vibrio gazogenes DSM 21264 = NBRC 103151]SJN55888.1 D-threonine aldolase [Vibrio gazogenes]
MNSTYLEKGHPINTAANILHEDVSLPALLLYKDRIENNIQWMKNFSEKYDVRLAPHAKTTMTPQILKAQLSAGAWGMTVANAIQAQTAYNAGCKNILMANQLVGKANMSIIADILDNNSIQFYCVVDSVKNVLALDKFFTEQSLTLNVLVELGAHHGRCGCRTEEQVNAVVQAINTSTSLRLSGVEFYEGVIHGDDEVTQVRNFIHWVLKIFNSDGFQSSIRSENAILTGAGSAWYDIVCEAFKEADLHPNVVPIIRPGCYVIHDMGIYEDSQAQIMLRNTQCQASHTTLLSAMELWAYVLSIPEPGVAIVGFGKRDVAFDAGLPIPLTYYHVGDKAPLTIHSGTCVVKDIMDQHAFMTFSIDLQVGDMISFGTSHPCLTFDKWREIAVVDSSFNIIDRYNTYF